MQRSEEWSIRLHEELKNVGLALFVTLTYEESNMLYEDGIAIVSKKHIQDWLKRLRKALPKYHIRYFLVSEYGPTTFRPHYHAILFGLPFTIDVYNVLLNSWNKGFIKVDEVTPGRIRYVAQYSLIPADLPEIYKKHKPFMLCSRKPGIGASYLNSQSLVNWHRVSMNKTYNDNGYIKALPRYYVNKIFDDDMKAQFYDEYKERNDIIAARLLLSRLIKSDEHLLAINNKLNFIKDYSRKVRLKMKKSKL